MEKTLVQIKTDCIKVVLYGPESTGKSTLSKALAKHYKTAYVPEFARAYLQEKWDRKSEICTKEDLVPIARGQIQLENEGIQICLLYTSPSPRDATLSRMPSSA